jgi:hypothetical protein
VGGTKNQRCDRAEERACPQERRVRGEPDGAVGVRDGAVGVPRGVWMLWILNGAGDVLDVLSCLRGGVPREYIS